MTSFYAAMIAKCSNAQQNEQPDDSQLTSCQKNCIEKL
jgi:hypothetical protein